MNILHTTYDLNKRSKEEQESALRQAIKDGVIAARELGYVHLFPSVIVEIRSAKTPNEISSILCSCRRAS